MVHLIQMIQLSKFWPTRSVVSVVSVDDDSVDSDASAVSVADEFT